MLPPGRERFGFSDSEADSQTGGRQAAGKGKVTIRRGRYPNAGLGHKRTLSNCRRERSRGCERRALEERGRPYEQEGNTEGGEDRQERALEDEHGASLRAAAGVGFRCG